MLTEESKLEIVEQLVASNVFRNAPTSMALLRFLVRAEIEGRPLKESIINIDFFGSKGNGEKGDSRVRVNIYNLRKKLTEYYEEEGARDLWQISLDKGQYEVRFEKAYPSGKFRFPSLKAILIYLLLILAVAAAILSNIPPRPSLIWKGFFKKKHATNLYIGDAFGYGGTTISGLSGWTRDFSINSLQEYYRLQEEKPELKTLTVPTEFNYSTRMAENATHDLSRLFTQFGEEFQIKYATRTSFDDIKKGNTIYVGRMKDQVDFVYLFNEANPYFRISGQTIEFSGHPTLPDTSIVTLSDGIDADFALVSRIPGPNLNEQFLFFSDHDIGVMATVEFFTNTDSLKYFSRRHLEDSPYFTAIYKAKGKERINLQLETIMVVPH